MRRCWLCRRAPRARRAASIVGAVHVVLLRRIGRRAARGRCHGPPRSAASGRAEGSGRMVAAGVRGARGRRRDDPTATTGPPPQRGAVAPDGLLRASGVGERPARGPSRRDARRVGGEGELPESGGRATGGEDEPTAWRLVIVVGTVELVTLAGAARPPVVMGPATRSRRASLEDRAGSRHVARAPSTFRPCSRWVSGARPDEHEVSGFRRGCANGFGARWPEAWRGAVRAE